MQTVTPQLPSPLQPFRLSHWPATSPKVWVKRDDLIHPIISGNKWRKLKFISFKGVSHIVSIGGGYSNHLHSLGYLCKTKNIEFTALVRGNYAKSPTPMLLDLQTWQCRIQYITKKHYAQREQATFSHWLESHFPNALFIPEGGSTPLALKGVSQICDEISSQISEEPDYYLAPVASGATLAGLINSLPHEKTKVLGVAVLNGKNYLESLVKRFLIESPTTWEICHDFALGGYGKKTVALERFIDQVFQETKLPLEPVYSGKLFYCLDQLITQGYFKKTDSIIAIHTGGLQGARK